jgi:hypothetical protein
MTYFVKWIAHFQHTEKQATTSRPVKQHLTTTWNWQHGSPAETELLDGFCD